MPLGRAGGSGLPSTHDVARDLARKARRKIATGAKPVAAGKLGPVLQLDSASAEKILRVALIRAAGGPHVVDDKAGLLWDDASDTLLLHPRRARLVCGEGVAVVSLPVHAEECGDAAAVVAFVTRPATDAVGFAVATESVPRGPKAVVDRFGDSLIAATWWALVETATTWTDAAGWLATGSPLVPAGLAATRAGFVVPSLGAPAPSDAERR